MAQKFNLEDYEPVHERLKKFYAACPDGRVLTNITIDSHDNGIVYCLATVYRDADEQARGLPLATGWASETRGDGYVNKTSHVENGETSAIGRALANCHLLLAGDKRPSREEMEKVQRNGKPAVDLAGEIATKITDEELKAALRTMVSGKKWTIPDCHSFCQTREWDNAKIMTDLLAYKQNMVADAFSGEAV